MLVHKNLDESSTEDTLGSHMEEVLQRQNEALKELKYSVEISDPDEDFTAERLTMLEDASHRQLEVHHSQSSLSYLVRTVITSHALKLVRLVIVDQAHHSQSG